MPKLTWNKAMKTLHPLSFSNGTVTIQGAKRYVEQFVVDRLPLEKLQYLKQFDNVKIKARTYPQYPNLKHETVYIIY